MPFTRAGQLARSVIAASVCDPIGLVAENLRAQPGGVMPVLDRPTLGEFDPGERNARVLGLISQADLARATQHLMAPRLETVAVANGHSTNSYAADGNGALQLNGNNNSHATDDDASLQTVALTAGEIMQRDVPYIPANFSLHNALLTLDRYDTPALPVFNDARQYLGMVSRADLLAGIHQTVRPPLVGGMANASRRVAHRWPLFRAALRRWDCF